MTKYKISDEKLKQQYNISALNTTTVAQFPNWLSVRAGNLAAASNQFLERLRGGLPLPAVVSAADTDASLMEAAE